MGQTVLGKIDVTAAYANIVTTFAGAANADVLIQNRGIAKVEIVPSDSASAPAADAPGYELEPGESQWFIGANLFARAWSASSLLVIKDS